METREIKRLFDERIKGMTVDGKAVNRRKDRKLIWWQILWEVFKMNRLQTGSQMADVWELILKGR